MARHDIAPNWTRLVVWGSRWQIRFNVSRLGSDDGHQQQPADSFVGGFEVGVAVATAPCRVGLLFSQW